MSTTQSWMPLEGEFGEFPPADGAYGDFPTYDSLASYPIYQTPPSSALAPSFSDPFSVGASSSSSTAPSSTIWPGHSTKGKEPATMPFQGIPRAPVSSLDYPYFGQQYTPYTAMHTTLPEQAVYSAHTTTSLHPSTYFVPPSGLPYIPWYNATAAAPKAQSDAVQGGVGVIAGDTNPAGSAVPAAPESSETQRQKEDKLLLDGKAAGKTYREIRLEMGSRVAESTLRGRFRSLTKPRRERVRKPVWRGDDVKLLRKVVVKEIRKLELKWLHLSRQDILGRLSWKKVANYISEHGGSYHFGNSTCKKKWAEIEGGL